MSKFTLYYETDSYTSTGTLINGRRKVGESMFKGLVDRYPQLVGTVRNKLMAAAFTKQAREIDPHFSGNTLELEAHWLRGSSGPIFFPGADLQFLTRPRARAGGMSPVCGVTYTLSSKKIISSLANLSLEQVYDWDAIICATESGKKAITNIWDFQWETLARRLGKSAIRPPMPMLPVAPLGIHVEQFTRDDANRENGRKALKITNDEIAVLYAGRLSMHAKAHPYPMLMALQMVAEQTGAALHLILNGVFANEATETVFKQAISQICPAVRFTHVNGDNVRAYHLAWSCADIFMSMSDNIQETFGLTPVEAMAAGLPVIASDWDGYKETIRHGVDGFRVPTLVPSPSPKDEIANQYDTGFVDYNKYVGRVAGSTAVSIPHTIQALKTLVENADLRKKMSLAGQERAASTFDWTKVLPKYEEIWQEQASCFEASKYQAPQVTIVPAAPHPFEMFGHFPSILFSLSSEVRPADGASMEKLDQLIQLPMFSSSVSILPNFVFVKKVLARVLKRAERSKINLIVDRETDLSDYQIMQSIGFLIKLGLVELVEAVEIDQSSQPI